MKKTLLTILVCAVAVGVVVLGIMVSPIGKGGSQKKAVASTQAQSQASERLRNLLAASHRNAAPKPVAKAKPAPTDEQIQNSQALHDRREKALQAKDSKALVALGNEVLEAASFPSYKKLAAMCFMDAAKLGSAEGMMRTGWCYQDGVGVDSEAKQAFNYYFQAGEAGLSDGYTAAARMVLAGNNNLGDMDTAMALIDKAMAAGNDEAKFLKGTVLLAQGDDAQSGLNYIMDAAKADYPDAQRLLGQLYQEGKYVPQDAQTAAEWAKYAADLGLPSASSDYAMQALLALTENNTKVATISESNDQIQRLVQASVQGDADAAYLLASIYLNTLTVNAGKSNEVTAKSIEGARNYAAMAFENGRKDAAFLMAATYSPNESDSINEWLKKGMQVDDWQCRYASGLIANENISPYDAVQQASKATLEEATNYELSDYKNTPSESTPPQAVSLVQPDIPAALRTIDLDTTVNVQFLVNEDGIPTNVQVTSPSPYEELNKAAVNAVSQWRFKPGTQNGVIVPVQMAVPIAFQAHR